MSETLILQERPASEDELIFLSYQILNPNYETAVELSLDFDLSGILRTTNMSNARLTYEFQIQLNPKLELYINAATKETGETLDDITNRMHNSMNLVESLIDGKEVQRHLTDKQRPQLAQIAANLFENKLGKSSVTVFQPDQIEEYARSMERDVLPIDQLFPDIIRNRLEQALFDNASNIWAPKANITFQSETDDELLLEYTVTSRFGDTANSHVSARKPNTLDIQIVKDGVPHSYIISFSRISKYGSDIYQFNYITRISPASDGKFKRETYSEPNLPPLRLEIYNTIAPIMTVLPIEINKAIDKFFYK